MNNNKAKKIKVKNGKGKKGPILTYWYNPPNKPKTDHQKPVSSNPEYKIESVAKKEININIDVIYTNNTFLVVSPKQHQVIIVETVNKTKIFALSTETDKPAKNLLQKITNRLNEITISTAYISQWRIDQKFVISALHKLNEKNKNKYIEKIAEEIKIIMDDFFREET